jgi:hypothetical protein
MAARPALTSASAPFLDDEALPLASKPLDQACAGRVLSERNMRSHLIKMGGVFRKDSSKVLRVEAQSPDDGHSGL